ncbi:uncharacterized protein LOC121108185 [Gallus gallus]|uniref:uncharacterized protein LOC121108185 n=1 Tax=Gallus gallus TaxID=9031 RepID=UPI001AE6C0E6|nr:uncharacterized protein LOC121108185 [Gallus gallus]XP_046790431.1 uncharacterized protein LOC121108185 [Gallus gallus]
MNLLFTVGALYKGIKTIMIIGTYWPIINVMISCCGIVFIYNQIRALMEKPAWYLYATWYNLNFDTYIPDGIANFTSNYIPDGIANFTNTMMFKPVSRLSSQFVTRFSNAELVVMLVVILVCMLSIFLNVLLSIRVMWMTSPPKSENADWQGTWRGLGKILEPRGPALSWDFTLEHLWDPEKLSQYLSRGWCSLDRSKERRLIWSLACAYRSLYNTILDGRLPPLLNFFCWGMESRCGLRRVSLKSCQLCSVPMPLRTVSQWIPLSSSLSSNKFALLKHWVLALLFARFAFLKITKSTRAWSLQSRLPPVLTSLMLFSALVSTRSSKASPQVSPANTWTRKLSLTDSRNLLEHLPPLVPF